MGAITVTLFALAGGANQFIALFNHFKEKSKASSVKYIAPG